jgi:hypothetical protein
MPKNRSLRKSTVQKTKASKSNKYKTQRGVAKRATRKPIAYCPNQASGDYHKPWLIPKAQKLRQEILTNRVKKLVEKYGEIAAKWHLARIILNRNIEDASPEDSYQIGKFVTFKGANTVDIVYVDTNANPNVYVLEAKGGKAGLAFGRRSGKHPPNTGKKLNQGDWNYLYDVANDMVNSGNLEKVAAGNAILNAYNNRSGKLHYIGVSAKIMGGSGPPSPIELFNNTR